jgi:RNA 2',3'-cyclic 3'-phosphodiesterase
VPLPEDIRQRLATAIERLRPHAADVAWVAPANLHVTVKFLGQIDDSRVSAIAAAVGAAVAGHRAFTLHVAGLGAFPTPRRPRVLWAGLQDAGGWLARLAGSVDAAVAAVGVPAETRPFAAHVTLGRVRESRSLPDLGEALARGTAFGELSVDRVVLMRSELSPRGARYTELAALPLLPGDAVQ